MTLTPTHVGEESQASRAGSGTTVRYTWPEITPEMVERTVSALNSRVYFLGDETDQLEKEFASFVGTKHAVCVSSGTAAEHLALLTLKLNGREVVTSANTFISTADCVLHAGGRARFVDTTRSTFTMDPAALKKLPKSVCGVIPVHMYGHPADMDPINEFAEARGLWVLEDACHAAGAKYKGRRTGSLGRAGFFSFASKNITAAGDGGVLTTDDEDLAYSVKLLRDHGRDRKKSFFGHKMPGFNLRIPEMCAAVARLQLKKLDEWNQERRRHADLYRDLLRGERNVVCPIEEEWAYHVYLHFALRVKNRERLRVFLERRGVETKILYNPPVHMQPAYKRAGVRFPNCESEKREVLCVPVRPNLRDEEVRYVADQIKSFYKLGP